MSDVLKRFGEVMYRQKLSKVQLFVLIAEMNGVSRQTVYNWLRNGSELEIARMNAALDDIEKESNE